VADKEFLDDCIDKINTDQIRQWVRNWLYEKTPDYFWTIPSSSSGKYHPSYGQGEGGLARHTKAAFYIALDLLDRGLIQFREVERDIILASILIHDTFKKGQGEMHSRADHPKLVYDEIIKEGCDEGSVRNRIAKCVASHMGQWNKDYKTGKEINAKPETEMEKFVHLCDYLASRKYLEFNFDAVK